MRYVPFDLPGAVRRFFARVQPRLAVIFETELWPNMYHECGRRRVPLVLASARISAKSVGRYRKLGRAVPRCLVAGGGRRRSDRGDAERFREMGADPDKAHVTGNLKFDFAVPPNTSPSGRRLRELTRRAGPCGLPEAPIAAKRRPCSRLTSSSTALTRGRCS